MKIAIEVQRLFRRKKHGMEIVALEILRELQKLDKRSLYSVFVKNDVDENCLKESQNLSITKIKGSCFPIWEQFKLTRAVKRSQSEVLHCTSNTAPLFCKIPLIITIHDVIYLETLNFSGSPYQNFGNIYRRLVVPMVAKNAAIILTVSEYEKNVIVKRLKVDANKVRVVYNGVNKQFKVVTDDLRLNDFRVKYKLPNKFLLHFGNTAPKKNTIGVLNAFKLYTESVTESLPLVLTDFRADRLMALLEQIHAPELIKNIIILDYVPFDNIPYLYNLATIFLYPSLRESFGMPLIEAMACGVPVITSDTSALPEIAGGAACLVDPLKPGQIAEQIKLLLSDDKLFQQKRADGFKNALRFNWKSAAKQTVSIYNEVLKAKIQKPQLPEQVGTMARLNLNSVMLFVAASGCIIQALFSINSTC
jgi:glycosyltransferase involved in cell wall biosynthesis